MRKLVTHNLQNVVHGSFPIVHLVNTCTICQQQIHYVWICVLTGHVQRSVFVLVHSVDISPCLQQHLAHFEVLLEVLHLLGMSARGVQGCETLIVLFVHCSSIAQVELCVVWEAVPGGHM